MYSFRSLLILLTILGFSASAAEPDDKVYEVPKERLTIEGKLTKDDPPLLALKGSPHRIYRIRLKQNQSYVFDLKSKEFAPYLIVEDAQGKKIAYDEERVGDTARVVLVPEQTGVFRVIAAAFDKKPGAFVLKVREGTDLNWTARVAEQKDDLPRAQQALEKLLAIQIKEAGETSWKVTDTRLAMDRLAALSKLDPKARVELKKSQDGYDKAGVFLNASRYKEAIEASQSALDIQNRYFGDTHPTTATFLQRLGYAYLKQGDYTTGRPYLEQSLAIRKQVLGPDHPETATTHILLGDLFKRQGDSAAAQTHYEQALSIRKKVLGEHVMTALSLNRLGNLHLDQRDYGTARTCFEQELVIRKKIQGEDHLDTATALGDLGYLFKQQENYPAARPCYEQVVAIRKKVLGENHPDTALALMLLGDLYRREANGKAAKSCYEQALAIRTKALGDHPSTANSLNKLGALHFEQSDYVSAQKYYEQAFAMYKKVHGENHAETATALDNLGVLLSKQGKKAEARPYSEQALAIRKKIHGENHLDTAVSLNNLGAVLHQLGEHTTAQSYYEQALAIRKKVLGENVDTALTLRNLGKLLAKRKEYAAARACFEEEISMRKKIQGGEHPEVAKSFIDMGTLQLEHKKHTAAQSCFEQAFAIRKKVRGENNLETAECLRWLGLVHYSNDHRLAARKCYEDALAILKKVVGDDHPDTAHTLVMLGSVHSALENYPGARHYLELALAIRKKIRGETHPDTADSLDDLGTWHSEQRDYATARFYYEQAFAIRKIVFSDNDLGMVPSYVHMSDLFNRQRDLASAMKYCEQALLIRKKALGEQHLSTADSLGSMANLLIAQGTMLNRPENFTTAKRYLEQALAIQTKINGENSVSTTVALRNLGNLLLIQGDYVTSKAYFEKALSVHQRALGDSLVTTASLIMLGSCLEFHGDFIAAADLYKKALDSQRRLLDVSAAGLAERQQLTMNEAIFIVLNPYLSLSERTGVSAADTYAQVLAWKGTVALRQRQLRLVRQKPELKSLVDELQSVCTSLSNLSSLPLDEVPTHRKTLEDLTRRKEAIEVELAQKSAAFDHHASREDGASALRAALSTKTALIDFLEYSHFTTDPTKATRTWERRLVAFVVRKDQPIVRVDLGPSNAVVDQVVAWRKLAKQQQPLQGVKGNARMHPGMELRRLVWLPLEKHLQGAETVLISPVGALTMLPFAALPGVDPTKFLLEERMIAVIPLPQLLPELLHKTPTMSVPENPSLFLLGNVDFGAPAGKDEVGKSRSAAAERGLDWRALPDTAGEIQTVKQLFRKHFPKGSVEEMIQGKATEAAVRSEGGKHRWIHLATHGFFASSKMLATGAANKGPDELVDLFGKSGVVGFHPGLLSGVVLAGANQPPEPGRDDGILTALEVAELNLQKADLVVLSACETGLGKIAGGEGVLGLQRSFQLAGAGTVVSSLWSVSDAATRKLMEKFYDNLWRERMSTGEALRQAQLWMMREGVALGFDSPLEADRDLAPPYFWAAFVLSGDWR